MTSDLERAASAAFTLRPAVMADIPILQQFVVALAQDDPCAEVKATEADLAEALFGARPAAEAVVAVADGRPVGFAIFYPTYSTVLGKVGIHLEDLFVQHSSRGAGIGQALLTHLAGVAVARGCGRLEWWVLRDNTDAKRFYERAHARGLDGIEVMRLAGAGLDALGGAPMSR